MLVTDAVWEFKLLLVRQDVTSGLLELHSTPWSSCQPLFPDDNRCKEFYNTVAHREPLAALRLISAHSCPRNTQVELFVDANNAFVWYN